MQARLLPILLFLLLYSGCNQPGTIEVDTTTRPVRFIVDHQGWPRPFWRPRVTEFAVASEEDGLLWQLESVRSEGEPADQLAFIYGKPPPGFRQLHPHEAAAPKRFVGGRSYFVAATGPNEVYRVVFALPQRAESLHARPREQGDSGEPDAGGFYPADPSQNPSDTPPGG